MNCHCHCGIEKRLRKMHLKRFGVLGVVLMGAHIMLHVVECLVLPSILIAFSSHAMEERAAETEKVILAEPAESTALWSSRYHGLVNFAESLQLEP